MVFVKMKENPERPGVFVTPEGRVFIELIPSKWEHGYYGLHIPAGKNRNRKPLPIRRHTLVAETYIGPKPFAGAHVRHLDGKSGNDHYKNLKWGTVKENGQDTIVHGRSTRGTRNKRHKLTEKEVLEIRERLVSGESSQQIADAYNVAQPTISNIYTGKTWGWLK